MIANEATPILIDILQSFISVLREIDPHWQKGYLRCVGADSFTQVKGSYAHLSGVNIINVLDHEEFFDSMPNKVEALLKSLEKKEGLVLLVVDSNLEYKVNLEFEDMNKWKITKMDGASGVPEGIN